MPIDPSRLRPLEAALGDLPLRLGFPLGPLTTFHIGGPAAALVEVSSGAELERAITAVRELELPHQLLGRGANVLVGDRGFPGVVIRSVGGGVEWLEDGRVRADAGVDVFHDLIPPSVERGLGGLHHYVGIPGTVGGALWQNLHFLSPDRSRTVFIEEILESAEILTEEGRRTTVDVDYFEFGYDRSILHTRGDIVLDATFRLAPAPVDELREVVRENLRWRDDRHPDLWLYPSAGSIFRKIEGIGAGRLIDQCGLKGKVLGRAGIFHRHANIIVNFGGATALEVRTLIDLCRETVFRETGHELVPEIGMIGDF